MTSVLLSLALIGQCAGGSCATLSRFAPTQFAPSLPAYTEAVASVPVTYEMADASGKVWTHASKSYLAAWIAGRNAGFTASRKAPGECGCDKCKCAEKPAWPEKQVGSRPPIQPLAEKQPKAEIDYQPDNDSIPPLVPPQKIATPKRGYRDAS